MVWSRLTKPECCLIYPKAIILLLANPLTIYRIGGRRDRSGIYSADKRFIGAPVSPFTLFDKEDHALILIVNAKSDYADAALRYAEYRIKGMDDVVRSLI